MAYGLLLYKEIEAPEGLHRLEVWKDGYAGDAIEIDGLVRDSIHISKNAGDACDAITTSVLTLAFMALFVDHGKIIGSFFGAGGLKILLSVLALCVLCTLVANTIVVKSASYVNSATTTILASMEIVVGALVGLLLFGETLTFLQIVGAVIIVVASLGMELAEKPAPAKQ